MNGIGPLLFFAVLFAIGYLPPQLLRTRRIAVVAGVAGLLVIPIVLVLLRMSPTGLNALGHVVALFCLGYVGGAVALGAAVRWVLLGPASPPPVRRRIVTAVAGVVLSIALFLLLRAISAAL